MRLFRIIGLLALAAALAACSTVKFAYGAIDEVAVWWLDGYVDFTDEQEQRARDELRRLHRWHRVEELPRLAALLRRMEEAAGGALSAQEVCAFVPALRERFLALTEQAAAPAVSLLGDMEAAQIAHLEKKYAKNNAEFRKQWVRIDPFELREKQAKQLLDRAETLYGAVGEAQRLVVERHVAHSSFDPRRALAERQRRQQDAVETVKKIAGRHLPPNEARSLLRAYLARAQASPDASHRAYQEELIAENCRGFAALHNSTSAAQRDAAAKRLRGWQRDLLELAAQP